jgi:hypothetical protein
MIRLDLPAIEPLDSRSANPSVSPSQSSHHTPHIKKAASRSFGHLLIAVFSIFTGLSLAHGQLRFIEKGSSRGIGPYVMAEGPVGGVAAVDFDEDGDIDIFVPNGIGIPDQLYRNRGNGRFDEVAASVGLDSLENHRGALWFDYDGDHDLDLMVVGDCRRETPPHLVPMSTAPCANPALIRLHRQNSDGTFQDVTVGSGLEVAWGGRENQHTAGIAGGDINNDGFLDVFITSWNGRAWLFRNNTDGTFTDITDSAGMDDGSLFYHMPLIADFNGDGRQDIYATLDLFVGNQLWINQGDESFVNVAPALSLDDAWTDMGLDLGDYDNDGDLDLYITNITKITAGVYNHNVFYRNDSAGGNLKFTEISQQLGVDDGYWGWGAIFFDADNDGWLDLATTNGKDFIHWATDHSKIFMNQGGNPVTFQDLSTMTGFDDTEIGSGLIAQDLDRDGDLDVLQTTSNGPLRFMENQLGGLSAKNHFVVIKPRMAGPNHFAAGAVVRIEAGTKNMMRIIKAGVSLLGQEPYEAFFGLGSSRKIDRLTIEWPGGGVSRFRGIPADQVITVSAECGSRLPRPSARRTGSSRIRDRVVRCDPTLKFTRDESAIMRNRRPGRRR